MSRFLIVPGILFLAIVSLSSCQRIEERDHAVCFQPRMDDVPRYWGDVEVRFPLRGEATSFRNRGRLIAKVWVDTPWWELDRAGTERVKRIAASIGGNGVILTSSRSTSDVACLEAHTGNQGVSGDAEKRWYLIQVKDVHRLRQWSQSPFYDADPDVRFKRVIDEWNGVSKLLFEMTSEMDWPEELILVESMWWDYLNKITKLKSIYRAESEGRGDFDGAFRLILLEAHQSLSRDMDEAERMTGYHQDDEFAEIYRLLDRGLESLMYQFVCELELWYSRTDR